MELSELEKIEVSGKNLCEILDFKNSNYLSELVKDHGFIRSAHGKYLLIANVKRKITYLQEVFEKEKKEIREGNSRSRLELAQAKYKELELAEKEKNLAPVAEFELSQKNETALFVKMFTSLGTQLKYDLNLSPEQNDIIQTKIDNFLKHYANLPPETNAESVTF